jgi:hypothetical protein
MGFVLRFLAVLFLLRLLLRFVVAVIQGMRTPMPDEKGTAVSDLVRDRVCNTFVPRSHALVASVHGEPAFFCSATCRDRALSQ